MPPRRPLFAPAGRLPSPAGGSRTGTRVVVLSPASFRLHVMAALQDALAATGGMREARKPPRLRVAPGRDRCGTCSYFKAKSVMSGAGVCRLYASYPVNANQLSDAYKPKGAS